MNAVFLRLKAQFGKSWDRGQKKVENNTYAYRYEAMWPHSDTPVTTIALVLHSTAIVYACAEATAAFGFTFDNSRTTKDRMRHYTRPSGSYFDAGAVFMTHRRIAELPHERTNFSGGWTWTKDRRAEICTDLRHTYVLLNDGSSNPSETMLWQPEGRGAGTWYSVCTDTVRPRAAIKALARAIDREYGELEVIAEMGRDAGDHVPTDANVARATHAYVTGFVTGQSPAARRKLVNKCCRHLTYRRRRSSLVSGKLAERLLAAMIAKHLMRLDDGGVGEGALGSTSLRNETTGEIVPTNQDDRSTHPYWLHPDFLQAFIDDVRTDEQELRQAGEDIDHKPELGGANARVPAMAECAG